MENKLNKQGKPLMKNVWFYVSVIAVIVILLLVYFLVTSDKPVGENIQNQGNQIIPGNTQQVIVSADDDAIKGNEDAPVTIIEFSDYECPFCARFFSQTYSQLKKEYIDTGKAKLIYRDFPLSFHQNAQKAAEAAECAGDEGDDKYYEMHDKLFIQGVSGGVSDFKKYAEEIGLNTESFNQCLDSGKYSDEVQADFADGQRAGVSGTPTFFINGKKLVGAQPFEVFQQVIEQELGN